MDHTSRLSSTMCSSNMSWGQKSKQHSMHEVIRGVRDYQITRSEETVQLIIRHLSLLGVAIDKSIYDPNTSVVCEFFSSLFELLSNIEPRSSLAWGCVGVLETACKNQATRHQLIHTYQFIPLLSQLLNDHLTIDKKIRILTVIQELSCGVKISWIIPNLQHLMSTLLKWIQAENEPEQVIVLALGIIINLCFKNLPGMYMLSKCIDIKEFAKFVLQFKGNKIDALVCKFLIIIDHIAGVVPEATFLRLLKVTFNSIKDSFLSKDPIELRQNIEFYFHVKVQGDNIRRLVMEHLKDYLVYVDEVTATISNPMKQKNSDVCLLHNPECMSLVFKFLKSVADWNLPNLEQYYEQHTRIALDWIQNEQVASDALSLLRSIVMSSDSSSSGPHLPIMELILDSMPMLIINLQNIDKSSIMNIDQCMRLSNIMELLKILVHIPETRVRVMAYLSEEQLDKVLQLAIGKQTAKDAEHHIQGGASDANNFTPEAFTMYINTLSLINCIAKHHFNWEEYLSTVLKHPQIHAILAESLYRGSLDVRKAVMEIIQGNTNFPCDLMATIMTDLCKNVSSAITSANHIDPNAMCYSLMHSISSASEEAIEILKEARNSNRIINIPTCDVMELYEYKIATMGHAERAAMASVEASSTRCTQLQHQVAQLTAELSRIRQLFLHTQQVQKESEVNIKVLEDKVNELFDEKVLKEEAEEELEKREVYIMELNHKIEEMNKAYAELENDMKNAVKVNFSLQESIKKIQRLNEKKEDINKNMQVELNAMNNRICKTEEMLRSTENVLEERTRELDAALKESEERRKLIETIMKLAHTHK